MKFLFIPSMNKRKSHIGCSSYATASWKNLFYPEDLPKKKWFEFYCQHFNTYELNGTFYKFPTEKSLLTWYDKAPENFLFSVKVPRIITHFKKLINAEAEIAQFYEVCKNGLKEKLACVLWQFPPSFDFSIDKLGLVIDAMNTGFKNVIEFRHKSWWNLEVTKALSQRGLIFCSVNFPNLPTDILQTSSIGYVRMHGNPELFYSQYTIEELETLFKNLTSPDFEELYVYFNNTASTAGIINAIQMTQIHDDP